VATETFDNASLRVVRDEDQGLYLIQIGVEGAYRTFATMKLGKMDQLRAQAREQSEQQTTGQTSPVPPPPAQ
jgi:hypothetical protein